MYSIYADGSCFYNDASPLEELTVLKPRLTLEDNAAGSLSFKLPQTNPAYDTIVRLVTDISVLKDGREIWAGRVLSDDTDFFNNRSIYCEGELAFLNDSAQQQKAYHCTIRSFLESVLDIHNQQVKENRRFTIGAVSVAPSETFDFVTDFQKTMDVVNSMVEEHGGHLRIRKADGIRYLDYISDDSLEGTDQIISFGDNLLDFTRSWDSTEYATAILPLGARKNGETSGSDAGEENRAYYLTVESVNEGKLYVENADAVTKYGWIEQVIRYDDETDPASLLSKAKSYLDQFQNGEVTVVLPYGAFLGGEEPEPEPDTSVEGLESYVTVESVNNGSLFVSSPEMVDKYGWIVKIVNFNEIDDPSELLEQAVKYLSELQFDSMQLELSALDLHYLNPEIKDIRLLDKIRVLSRPHKLDAWFTSTKLEIPLDSPENSQFTLGDTVKTSLTQVSNQVNADLIKKIDSLPKGHDLIKESKTNAAEIIRSATTGHITITQNRQGADTLYISEGMDYTKSQRLWIWNMGGLAYSKDGGKTVEVAMTMDGSITANFITVGTMSAERVRTGILRSENDNFYLNLNDGTLTMKKGSIDIGDGNFVVTDKGEMKANEAEIRGTIHASAGDIAGFTLEPEYMHTGGGNYYVAMNGSDTNEYKDYAFWAGNPVAGNAPFWVKKNGEIYASKGTFSGKLEAATGNFLGVVQAKDFLDSDGNSMLTNEKRFKPDYLDLYGLTIKNKSTGLDTFKVDANGNVSINGNITMGAATTIDWALVTNENLDSNPAYSLAKQAQESIPGYIHSTHIDATTIESPTIRGGTFYGEEFNIIANGERGSLNLYGQYDSINYHMLSIDYYEGDSPVVSFFSPCGAVLCLGERKYGAAVEFACSRISVCKTLESDCDIDLTGAKSIDFTGVKVIGLKL